MPNTPFLTPGERSPKTRFSTPARRSPTSQIDASVNKENMSLNSQAKSQNKVTKSPLIDHNSEERLRLKSKWGSLMDEFVKSPSSLKAQANDQNLTEKENEGSAPVNLWNVNSPSEQSSAPSRPRRQSIRTPKSYREPSLNTKVRKGHNFFTFQV